MFGSCKSLLLQIKVGQYFNPGETLNFNGFEVVVKNSEQLPHFAVSTISVSSLLHLFIPKLLSYLCSFKLVDCKF